QPHLTPEQLDDIPKRVRLADLLGRAIQDGIKLGKLREWPKVVIATAHWTRSDLGGMADFAEFKDQFDAVNKTYVSLKEPYKARFGQADRHVREFFVRLVDTQLLAPGVSKTLEAVGQRYGLPKLDTGYTEVDGKRTPYKSCMDRYLADHPDKFAAYAIRDAQIGAMHVQEIARFARDELGIDGLPPLTLGGLAVKFLLGYWQ